MRRPGGTTGPAAGPATAATGGAATAASGAPSRRLRPSRPNPGTCRCPCPAGPPRRPAPPASRSGPLRPRHLRQRRPRPRRRGRPPQRPTRPPRPDAAAAPKAPEAQPEGGAPGHGPQEGAAEDPVWLAAVQAATLGQLQALSREAHWAARTASLRTLEQLPRARASAARSQGTLLAEASGPKGHFRLLEWEGEHVLVEERGRRQTLYLVEMVHAVSPRAYAWYLSRFGRTSPLAVALALLPLWQKGTTDEHGRLQVSKSGHQFVIAVEDDRIIDCGEELALAAS